MLLAVLAAISAGTVAVLASLHAGYPHSPRVKSPGFKVSMVAVAVSSAVLTVIVAIEAARSSDSMDAAVRGVTTTVFDNEIELTVRGSFQADRSIGGFLDSPMVLLSVIPRDSVKFCEVGVTHTPTLDSALGRMVNEIRPAPKGDLIALGDPAAQVFKFHVETIFEANTARIRSVSQAQVLNMSRRWTVDEYGNAQFIAEILVPGRELNIESAALSFKGRLVPLHFVDWHGRTIASTVFRPTWESAESCAAAARGMH